MKYFNFLTGMLFSIVAHSENGLPFERDYLLSSTSVLHVRVVEAKEQYFSLGGELHTCGINYQSLVLHNYKGKVAQNKYSFSSVFPLLVGEEYFLTLGRGVSKPSLTVDWPKEYQAKYSACEKKLYESQFQETDAFLVWDYPYDLDGKWLEVEDDNIWSENLTIKRKACLYGEGQCSFVAFGDVISWYKKNP